MARLPRLSVGGLPHLLVQRSHHGQPVFIDDSDRTLFRNLLGDAAKSEGVALHAYALMDDQVRLLATPGTAEALGRMMQTLGRRYGGAFNRRHARSGGLWEGRFRATIIEPERHLLEAMRYLEDEHNWDGGVAQAEGGPVSSRGHHVGRRQDSLVTDHALFWALGNTPFDREVNYRRLLEEGLAPAPRERLESAVRTGWPLGSEAFVADLSGKTERRLVPLKRGRPPKAK
jgi:putative transposase